MESAAIDQMIADAQARIAAERDPRFRALLEAELAAYTDARDLAERYGLTREGRSKVFNKWYPMSRKRDRTDLPDLERHVAEAYAEAGVRAELALFGERR